MTIKDIVKNAVEKVGCLKYFVCDREAGNIIDEFETVTDAMEAIKDYEESDKAENIFTSEFYQIGTYGENGREYL